MAPILDSLLSNSIKDLLILLKNVSGSILGPPSILYLLYALLNAPSSNLGPGFQFKSAFRASLLAIKASLFFFFFALLIFLFISAIFFLYLSFFSICFFLFGECSLKSRRGPMDSSFFSDSFSFLFILSKSLFKLLIFFS